jgi:hypothetical protein
VVRVIVGTRDDQELANGTSSARSALLGASEKEKTGQRSFFFTALFFILYRLREGASYLTTPAGWPAWLRN